MKIFLLLLIVFAITALSQTKEGDTSNGKRLFERNGCYQCHGYVGQGGTAGARLAQTKLPLVAFTAYVRNPASGGMPPSARKSCRTRNSPTFMPTSRPSRNPSR